MNKVHFEATPNPATMKFVFSESVIDFTQEFKTAQEASMSPLAAKIFGFPWTSAVFLGPDFISVTKQDWVDWDVLSEPLAGLIQEHLQSGEPVILNHSVVAAESEELEDDPEIVKQIKRAIAREIRPVVALDGGDLSFVKYVDNKLFIQMKGACSGCPSSQMTLKNGIEVRLKELFPELIEVIAL